MEELKNYLEEVASNLTHTDQDMYFNPYEASGGNYDDAFYMGLDDGKIMFARKLLVQFFKEQK